MSLVETETVSEHESNGKICEDDFSPTENDILKTETSVKKPEYKIEIVWQNVIVTILLHLWALYGLKLLVFDVSWKTRLFCLFLHLVANTGMQSGSHRLWTHHSYKATFLLRLILCFCSCVGFQDCIYDWCRNHRVHHKYADTDADPYNAQRGFFFAHIGWFMCKKHPDVSEKGKGIDLSDLRADAIVMFQRKYFLWLGPIFCVYLPTTMPHYLWGEDIWHSFYVCFAFRFILLMHGQGAINSFGHLWGDRPYDKNIQPSESMTANVFTIGEGFHNFHHTFPWDYSASEWGWKFNMGALFIDTAARLGLAYDLKKVPQEIVDQRRELKGDGSEPWYPEILYQRKQKAN